MPRLACAIALMFAVFSAAAVGGEAPRAIPGEGWSCWNEASARYGVPVMLLYAVARHESGLHAGAVHVNGGSYDVGLMQINSWHFPQLKKLGITPRMLVEDPCLNLNVGAWLLSLSIHQYGFNWKGIGAYNAATPWKRARYARQIAAQLRLLAAAESAQ